LERGSSGGDQRWRIHTDAGHYRSDWLVVAAGLGSPQLLQPLGHARPQRPVLGQALELQLPAGCNAERWPGSVSWDGINLVPRPGGRLWLGATVEPGLSRKPGSPRRAAPSRRPWARLAARGRTAAPLAGPARPARRQPSPAARTARTRPIAHQRSLPQWRAAGTGHSRLGAAAAGGARCLRGPQPLRQTGPYRPRHLLSLCDAPPPHVCSSASPEWRLA
jgi:glycine/D-amino acid oxidase-like deaminating enzyme